MDKRDGTAQQYTAKADVSIAHESRTEEDRAMGEGGREGGREGGT